MLSQREGYFPRGGGRRAAVRASPLVAGLVLVMPPVEVVVEHDDASGGHAGNDAPGRGREKAGLSPLFTS